MKNITIEINAVSFPSQLATDAEKASDTFGLQIGQAIQYEWFRKDGSSCRYYGQWQDFRRLRLYARGEQPIGKYKNELAIDGDLSYLNLDWTPVPILPKFIDIVVNGMSDRLFKVKAYAQDAMSQAKRSKYQDMVESQMISKDILYTIKEKTGIDTFMTNPDNLPETDEELSLYMQLNYKPAIEIAEEEAINTIFDENHYDDSRKRLNYDIATIGIAVAKHEFLQGTGVQVSYVDPANVVYSYTEDPFFKDCFYWGEIKTLPIAELMKIDQSLTREDLQQITQYSQAWYDYYNVAQFYENSMFFRDTCTLLYFNYKTTKKIVYKKKNLEGGGSRVIEKDENFNPPTEMMEEGNFEKIEKTIDVWYEGIMVMGTNILLQWKMCENMVRPKSASQHAIPNYVACAPRMYKGVIESLCRRMIPFADLIQITHLKLQQVIARTVPDGVFIDADGLNEIDSYFSQKLVEDNPFIKEPDKIYVEKILIEKDKSYHIWGKIFSAETIHDFWIPRAAVIKQYTENLVDVDYTKYENRPPLAHQKEAIEKLLKNDKFILADDMGLGKTTSAVIASIESGAKKI